MIYFLQNAEPMAVNTTPHYKNASINHYDAYNSPYITKEEKQAKILAEKKVEENMMNYWEKTQFEPDFFFIPSNLSTNQLDSNLIQRRNYIRSKFDNDPKWSYISYKPKEKPEDPQIKLTKQEVEMRSKIPLRPKKKRITTFVERPPDFKKKSVITYEKISQKIPPLVRCDLNSRPEVKRKEVPKQVKKTINVIETQFPKEDNKVTELKFNK